ncbi:hypothetical protein [Streptomyces sp. NRRL S-813]|uniref:hypothetical protein n=1 Tax=Streptomyces sp. NRRL S-813 TaxID=1463919 RepID=UPI00056092C9|nr:hypothetical protein [Streptomyces sp. NRRL S-813]
MGYAGAVLLRKPADRVGLTSALAAVMRQGSGAGWRERAQVIVQFAVVFALGARNRLETGHLRAHHRFLSGRGVSDSTMRRTLTALDETVLAKIGRCGPGCVGTYGAS